MFFQHCSPSAPPSSAEVLSEDEHSGALHGRGEEMPHPTSLGTLWAPRRAKISSCSPCQPAETLWHSAVLQAGGNETLSEWRVLVCGSRVSASCAVPGRAVERGWLCVHGCASGRLCWASSHASRHWGWGLWAHQSTNCGKVPLVPEHAEVAEVC